ncbi:hypothetical protein [Nitrobacter sp. TKz-YC02]|uniref:hypothetical protein n=1 Tax=Nitrobacter sp. TKz-YC02 TaxID=3398704 RepID=UPI003CE6E837
MALQIGPAGFPIFFFFAARSGSDFAAAVFCCREFAAGLFEGGLSVPAPAGFSLENVRRVFLDMIVV